MMIGSAEDPVHIEILAVIMTTTEVTTTTEVSRIVMSTIDAQRSVREPAVVLPIESPERQGGTLMRKTKTEIAARGEDRLQNSQ
jgi:hypothetical protein